METPQHELDVAYGYWMGQSPVTVVQYQSFIDDGGYKQDRFWSEAGRAWRDKNSIKGPEEYSGVFSLPNHPVVGVSWYEAHAFAKWLTEKARAAGWISEKGKICLPNEAEWEKAARGGTTFPTEPVVQPISKLIAEANPSLTKNENQGRIYPWGDQMDAEKCSYGETGIGSPSTPGCFPGGMSSYGCEDMSGNVWEWQRNKSFPPYPYPLKDQSWDDPEGDEFRVLRGVSFYSFNFSVRCAYRYLNFPSYRLNFSGFRVIALPLP